MPDLTVPGGLAARAGDLNAVDLILLLALLLHMLDGVRRGFIAGMLVLSGMVLTLLLSIKGYRPAAEVISRHVVLPPLIASIAGFFAVLLIAQIGVTLFVRLLLLALKPVRVLLGPLVIADHILGMAPGLVQGLMIAALILTPLRLFPVYPPLTEAIEQSAVASQIATRAAVLVTQLEGAIGEVVETELLSRTRIVQPDEEVRIPPLTDLRPDPKAEQAMLALVNAERVRAGLHPLAWDDRLRDVARRHSEEMLKLGYFAHRSPTTGTPADRVLRYGIIFATAGENLAFAPAVEVAHAGLMNSPSHRQTILDPAYTRIGIGVVSAGIHGSMFTQNFTG